MIADQCWIIRETNSGESYYYSGFFRTGKPVFNMAIADCVQMASLSNAKMVYNVINKILPCEILLVANNTVTKVFPE